jgi:hypothetical protein
LPQQNISNKGLPNKKQKYIYKIISQYLKNLGYLDNILEVLNVI